MEFQDLSMYGLMAPCAYARISGCIEGCGTRKQSCEVFIRWDKILVTVFTIYRRQWNTFKNKYYAVPLQHYCRMTSYVVRQAASLPAAIFPHMENASGGTPKSVAYASQTYTLLVVVMQNPGITHQTPP